MSASVYDLWKCEAVCIWGKAIWQYLLKSKRYIPLTQQSYLNKYSLSVSSVLGKRKTILSKTEKS